MNVTLLVWSSATILKLKIDFFIYFILYSCISLFTLPISVSYHHLSGRIFFQLHWVHFYKMSLKKNELASNRTFFFSVKPNNAKWHAHKAATLRATTWLALIHLHITQMSHFKFATLSDGVLCTIEMYSYSCTANMSQKQWWVQPKLKLR